MLSPDVEALCEPCVRNEPPGDPHRGRADRLELHDLNELGEEIVPGVLNIDIIIQVLGLDSLHMLRHLGRNRHPVRVLGSHHEDVGGVGLEVGDGVGLGVDPDGGHHPASLEVTAVILDGVTDQRGGALVLVRLG